MARKRFDLTNALKLQIYRSSLAISGGVPLGIVIDQMGNRYHDFSTGTQAALIGGTTGFLLSLIWGLRDSQAEPKQPRQSFGIQAGSDYSALPPVASDDYVRVNDTYDMRKTFETAMGRLTGSPVRPPRTVTVRTVADLLRGPQPITAKQLHYPAPVEREAVHFWANNVQLSGDVVWRFLRYAERNRARGAGLSERYWTRRNRAEWWNERYYKPMIALLDFASKRSNVQLVIIEGNQWRVLSKSAQVTYKIIAWAVHGVG